MVPCYAASLRSLKCGDNIHYGDNSHSYPTYLLTLRVDKREIKSRSKTCEKCEDGLNQLRKEIDLLKKHKDKKLLQQLKEMQTKLHSVMGAVKTGVSYMRWGRATCRTPATTVYTGDFTSNIWTK